MPYLLSCMFASLLLGTGWFVLDRRIGLRLYRFVYDLTHEAPLPDSVERGFIFNQRAQSRLSAAIVLCAVQSVLLIIGSHEALLLGVFAFFVEVPAMMVGFYVGPFVDRVWSRRDTFLDKVDKLERGEVSVRDELMGVSRKAVGAVREAIIGEESSTKELPTEPTSISTPVAGQSRPSDPGGSPTENPRDMMNRYLRRDGDGGRGE